MKEKIAAIIVCLFAVIPNIQYNLQIGANTKLWFYLVLVSGFFGFLYLYTKAHWLLKATVIYCFINCFLSRAPYLSFTAYLSLILAAYFYLLCLEVEGYKFIYKAIQALFFLNITLIGLQLLGYDRLMNFGHTQITYFGTVGNPMILGTFLVCLSPFLIMKEKLYFIPILILSFILKSLGSVVALLAGLFVWVKGWRKVLIILLTLSFLLIVREKIGIDFKYGRFPVWKKTIQLSIDRPQGYGMGTYKFLFPVWGKDVAFGVADEWEREGLKGNWLCWPQAHNCPLQLLFEIGFLGFALMTSFIFLIGYRLYKLRKITLLSGLVILITIMCFHFPTRMIQTVPMIILFLAICEKEAKIVN